MAPRKKKQPTRYDAAYDHLGSRGMGFTKRAIRKKIDSLLKVYGKDNGWIFIEEGFYEVLIDHLLEDPEPVLLLKGPGDEKKKKNKRPMREDSTIIEKRITRSASAAMKSNAIDIYKPTDSEPMTEEVKNRLEKKRSVASFLFGRGDSVPLLPAPRKEKSQRELTGLDDGKLVSAQEKKLQKKRSLRKSVRLSTYGNGDDKLVSGQEEELQDGNDGGKLVSSQEEELQDRNDDGKLVSAHVKKSQKKRSRRKFVRLSAYGNGDGRSISVAETSNTIEIAQPTEVEISDPTRNEIPQRCSGRPCFGFYCSDDDGEDDSEENYVYYETKASLRERLAKEGSATLRKESMSRWDVVGA